MNDKLLISHRGNIYGPNPDQENRPEYIQIALDRGCQVEVDVWYKDGQFYLGHDEPQYETDYAWLSKTGLWIHCKNIDAVSAMISNIMSGVVVDDVIPVPTFFWHETDSMTFTNTGFIWVYPGRPIPTGGRSIAVLPELHPDWDLTNAIAICTDYVDRYHES